jgi:hypothetical protein
MVVVLRKPVPLTVRVSGPDPASTLVGLIEVTVGVACVVPPEVDEDPPPQPARIADTRRQQSAQNKLEDFIVRKYSADSTIPE